MIFEDVQNCKNCELCNLKVNKIRPFDKDRLFQKGIFVIAQNPSFRRRNGNYKIFDVDENKNDFVFKKAMEKLGYKRDDYYVTNIVKCSTSDNNLYYYENKDIINACLNHIYKELEIIKPKIIIVLGNVAKEIISHNFLFFSNYKLIYIYHPSYYLRQCNYSTELTIENIYKDLKEKFK